MTAIGQNLVAVDQVLGFILDRTYNCQVATLIGLRAWKVWPKEERLTVHEKGNHSSRSIQIVDNGQLHSRKNLALTNFIDRAREKLSEQIPTLKEENDIDKKLFWKMKESTKMHPYPVPKRMCMNI